ncbi:MAG TPA: hypothetical protein PKK61_09065, partial [Defluviitaleaceae bacterium]|nr:hypothetical protein [Defluviitaleaceae bacterium]
MIKIGKIKGILNLIAFLSRNIFYSFKMPKFEEVEIENYKIGPLKRENLYETLELYKKLHDGKGLSLE